MITFIRFIKFRLIANEKYELATCFRKIEKKLMKIKSKLSAIF